MSKEKYLIMRDRQVHLTPLYWNAISEIFSGMDDYHGQRMPIYFSVFKNGRNSGTYLTEHWEQCEQYFCEKLFDYDFILNNERKKIEASGERIKKFITQFNDKKLKDVDFASLITLAHEIQAHWIDYDRLTVPYWFFGGDAFKTKVENRMQIDSEDFAFLTTPITKTAVSQMELDVLRAAKSVVDDMKVTEDMARELSARYGWIPFGYDGPEYWTAEYFAEELKKHSLDIEKLNQTIQFIVEEDVKRMQKRRDLEIKYNLNYNNRRAIEVINLLAIWTDDRKQWHFQLHYFYDKILQELANRFKISYLNLKYLFTHELEILKSDLAKALSLSTKRINHPFIVKVHNDRVEILSNSERDEILSEIEAQQNAIKMIKGVVASRGNNLIYRGVAKVLASSKEVAKINEGDILVTSMTTPDYIIAMQKAVGFITDEGGVTCHAAIVAREMNKPCIIGTKIATKKIKDGDLVEMDMKNGEVI